MTDHNEDNALRYEDAAEYRKETLEFWECKKCHRMHFGPNAEHFARYCCCDNMPCQTDGCSGRAAKYRLICDSCNQAAEVKRWETLESRLYDGTPVCEMYGDEYFFCDEELRDYLYDNDLRPSDVMLVFAEKVAFRWDRGLSEWFEDELSEDSDWDTSEIDKQIDEWVRKNHPSVYTPGKIRVDLSELSLPIEDTANA